MCIAQYNILFLYSSAIDPFKGGVESVTSELSSYFISKGSCCYYLSLHKNNSNNIMQFNLPNSVNFYNEENIAFVLKFVKDKNINILINQGGISKDCSQLSYVVKPYGIKVVSCIHNSLLDTVRNFDILYYNKFKKYKLEKLLFLTKNKHVKKILYTLYYLKYTNHYRKLYENSDKIVLLSDSFKKDFFFFVNELTDKVCSIPNPIPSKISESKLYDVKENILLYVGRIDSLHKKVDFLLKIWSLLHKKHKDWKLVIVGGGNELEMMKEYANSLCLTNVYFEGFQEPLSYYKKASIFCMTSASEGFGIVLVEAMNMGLLPVAFDSFPAVRDIIDDGINGILIPPFDIKLYAEKVSCLIENVEERMFITKKAYEKSQEFHLDEIGYRWMVLFSSLF